MNGRIYERRGVFIFLLKVIKHYRLTCGLSGYNLRRKFGISQQQISRYENGVGSLSFHMLNKILHLDDSEIVYFF